MLVPASHALTGQVGALLVRALRRGACVNGWDLCMDGRGLDGVRKRISGRGWPGLVGAGRGW